MTASGDIDTFSLGRRAALLTIRSYQILRAGHTSPCRFLPTCSEYAAEAIGLHGVRRGTGLTLRRLLRCRPGGPFGSDPVPESDLIPTRRAASSNAEVPSRSASLPTNVTCQDPPSFE